MKILLINKFHYLAGGAERHYFDVAQILKAHGHEVAYFAMDHEKNVDTGDKASFVSSIDYHAKNGFFKKIASAGHILWNFEAQRNLEKLVQEFKPDVAHLHNIYHQLSPSIIATLKKYDVPVCMTLHDYKCISPNRLAYDNTRGVWKDLRSSLIDVIRRPFFDHMPQGGRLKSALCYLEYKLHRALGIYERVDQYLAPSRFLQGLHKKWGIHANMKVLQNPLSDLEARRQKYENYSASDDRGKDAPFVFVGRITKEKGVQKVIEALEHTRKDVIVMIAGTGPYEDELKKMAEERGYIENGQVQFLGGVYGDDLLDLVLSSRAILAPSLWYENQPYVITEALALGRIVVGSEMGGIPDLIEDGKNGFLFEPNDLRRLASLLNIISGMDKKDLLVMEEQALESAIAYDPEAFYKKLIKIYKNLK